MAKRYWLLKSEPDSYSIDDLKRDGKTSWDGVRNYQARNFMRDDMKAGDEALFYHSGAEPPGVVGIARVCKEAYPDATAFDKNDSHFDSKSKKESPTWMAVEIEFVKKFLRIVSLDVLKTTKDLEGMAVLQRGQRLSVQPVEAKHFQVIKKLSTQ